MKPRLIALMLLACTLLLVVLIPAAAAQPVVPEGLVPPDGLRQVQPYRPPAHMPQREIGADTETQLVPENKPGDPLLIARRTEFEEQRVLPRSILQTSSAGPLLPITAGPERIPGSVLGDSGDSSYSPSISADGRYIAFWSYAGNLVAGDTLNHEDVFVYDSLNDTLERISVPPSGEDIWGYFYEPSISDDGRYVAFSGWTQDLAFTEEGWNSDIYVKDRNNGSVINISLGYNGDEASDNSYGAAISPDGKFVVFYSYADNLVVDDFNGSVDIFLYDMSTDTLERVSVDTDEAEGNNNSYSPVVSNDGQFVAYYSYATNLVTDDTNDFSDIFVRDRVAGTTTRITVNSQYAEADGESYEPDITPDGRYIAYESYAENLVDTDANGFSDIFIWDRQDGITRLISLDESGNQINDYSQRPRISDDGSLVAFDTWAGLIASDSNDTGDIYISDWNSGTIILGSVNKTEGIPNSASVAPALSANGEVIAFESYASDIVVGDTNDVLDIYARNLTTNQNTWASKDGFPFLESNANNEQVAISENGQFVVFSSAASNLVASDTNRQRDIFAYDRNNNQTTRISQTYWGGETQAWSDQPSISDDGRYIAFFSYDDEIVNEDFNDSGDIFVFDQETGDHPRISIGNIDDEANNDSFQPVISGNGNFVAFVSYADNLVSGDNNGSSDIFVADLTTAITTRVSVDSFGNEGNSDSDLPAISEDGRYIAFVSYADNLVDNDNNGNPDVFVHDSVTGETILVSVNIWDDSSAWGSSSPSISADGRYVAFDSYSYDLVEEDENGAYDIFVRDLILGVTSKVTHAPGGAPTNETSFAPDISADGRYITFSSWASNLTDGPDTNETLDTFVYDRLSGETVRLSESAGGNEANNQSLESVISADGTTIAFTSLASNLVPDDDLGYWDIFAVEQAVGGTLFSVSGTVYDDGGWPLEDVQVAVAGAPGNFTTTDANGQYTLTLPPGTYYLNATRESWVFLPFNQTVTVGPNQTGVDFDGAYNDWQAYWFAPTDDSYVNQGAKTTKYGSAAILRVKNATTDMNAYLRFDVDGFTPQPGSCYQIGSSYLVNQVKEPSTDGGNIYLVGNNWSESTLTWNNAPAITGSPLGSFGAVTDETSAWGYIGNPVKGNGVYSFAIRNNSSNSVDYSSKEGQYSPWLYVIYKQDFPHLLQAGFSASRGSGLAPMTVEFGDESNGCPESWHWDFGDGTTSTERNPSHTYTSVGLYEVIFTVTNSEGSSAEHAFFSVEEPPSKFYISPSTNVTIGGIPSQAADILLYDKPANQWTMVYDGSARGTLKNITAFAFSGDDLLLVFGANQTLPVLGTATPYDVVRFTPNNPGVYPLGSGTYSWEWRGKPNGLSTTSEIIDAFAIDWGDWLFSTTGAAALPTTPILKAADEDLIVWPTWVGFWNHIGLDGSTIAGLGVEDINGSWVDPITGDVYITIAGAFNLGGVAGNGKSIIRLDPNGGSTWNNTTVWKPSLVQWLAPGATFPSNIDAIELAR